MFQEKQISEEFGVSFLLQFTRELIKHAWTDQIEPEKLSLSKKEGIKQKVKQTIKEESKLKKEELSPSLLKKGLELSDSIPKPKKLGVLRPKAPVASILGKTQQPIPRSRKLLIRPLKIPEPKFPQRLQYLKPIPTHKEINLEKLDSLIKDPAVRLIQCDGANQSIIVIGTMGMKRTGITLTKEEIDGVLKKFSETSKIPLQEGIFRVVVGKLILLAIISKVISSKFIIKKMMYTPKFQTNYYR